MNYNGIDIEARDFPGTLQGYIAFCIAFAANTHCCDKEAAVELLMHEAENIIERVKIGKPPETAA